MVIGFGLESRDEWCPWFYAFRASVQVISTETVHERPCSGIVLSNLGTSSNLRKLPSRHSY